jgi:zinc/manganese transport system ATP-binding protein
MDAKTTFDLLELVRRWKEEAAPSLPCCTTTSRCVPISHTLLLAREVVAWGRTEQVLTDANLKRAVDTAAHWQDRAAVCQVDGVNA